MNSKVSFSVLAVAIICLLPMTSGHSTYSMEQTSSSSSSNSTTSQGTITVGSTEQPRWRDHAPDEGSQPSKSSDQDDDDDSESAPESEKPTRTTPGSYGQEPEYMGGAPYSKNSTYISDPSVPSPDTPTPTVNCPGPTDPATGEGYLDSDQNCAIACYNNLVLNQAGDACVCPPTFQFDPVEVKCICRSPFVLRGSKCVLLPSQVAGARHSNKKRSLNSQLPFGVEMLHGKYLRTEVDRLNCPSNEISCQMPSGGYECLDPDVTLDSCGGCLSAGTGVDCRNMTGAGDVGCSAGVCQAITCQKGYRLIDGKCIRNPRRRS
ncbi:hypothetical protein PGT21_005230 [Puccinia graminis f. sp. tritici]|uniref:Protein CPL1-like domain-containing protein n=2 Tax=Puccinia graminis f. sp. tritici TaxID=56615 RepID=E3KL95_PUCGT|nr:uncharacterized protein PGTG_11239 [Puccinia graminis f. sp. tritici CRL 75-36-700-3]EFP85070.1 hypothetical protein PGTG_11239 [Puccinia graminis f. sp. tritici CRL 75-36-700-3]KAA1064494.1 hypothetical protein PGT21_005230 [Puccinia graminis f. sp. tritici]